MFSGPPPPTEEQQKSFANNSDGNKNTNKMASSTRKLEKINDLGESQQTNNQQLQLQLQQQTQQPQLQQQQPTHSNIFLVRGARTENGQIILQNSHELLSLLNDSGDDKPILLQQQQQTLQIQQQHHQNNNQRKKIGGSTTATTTTSTVTTTDGNQILINGKLNDNSSIVFQQRLNKNGGLTVTDGPILLQTLKRLDKTQPILVFRTSSSNTTNTNTNTTSVKITRQQQLQLQSQTIGIGKFDEITTVDETKNDSILLPLQKQHNGNIPLGSGEYEFTFIPFLIRRFDS